MSDYKRFVSYIYGYDQGEKRENTGFVKVNARGGECRIWVHVRGFYSSHQKPYRVYAFARKRERLEGQYLGELESRNGALEWNGVTETDSLMGGFSLEESRGIYIEGDNRVLAAEWDDYPVDVDRFEPLERSVRQAYMETAQRTDAEDTENAEAEPQRELRAAEVEQAVKPGDVPDQMEAGESAAEEPIRSVPEDARLQQWTYLINRFPVMRCQDGNGGVLSGIRLGSRELARIPRDKWELGNNSFLLHGFYQHHHLLLLRKQTEQEICYYIGVPGVYNEKEQMLASMFGFEEFKVIKGPEAQEGSFGYWCRRLK